MKCRAKTYKYHSDPCKNTGAVDGYCYLHHPEVMLAKFRFQLRSPRPACQWSLGPTDLVAAIKEQEALLAEIAAQPVQLSPRMDATVAAADPMPVLTGQLPGATGHRVNTPHGDTGRISPVTPGETQ